MCVRSPTSQTARLFVLELCRESGNSPDPVKDCGHVFSSVAGHHEEAARVLVDIVGHVVNMAVNCHVQCIGPFAMQREVYVCRTTPNLRMKD